MKQELFISPLPTIRLSRRQVLTAGAAASTLVALGARPAHAVLKLDITQGTIQPLPVAILDFLGGAGGGPGDVETGRNLASVITNNLRRCGLSCFRVKARTSLFIFGLRRFFVVMF